MRSSWPFKISTGFTRDLGGDLIIIVWLTAITRTPDNQDANPTSAYYLHETCLSRSTSPCLNSLIHKMFTVVSISLDSSK